MVNGHHVPWEFRNDGAYDGAIQANDFEGVMKRFDDEPWWAGLYWWKWDEQQNRPHFHQPGGDTGFTVRGKPAAEAMRRRCAATQVSAASRG